jgi:hypothetical protein
VRWRAGAADQGWSNLTIPGTGLVEKWHEALAATQSLPDHWLAWGTLLATLGVTVQVIYIAAHRRLEDHWWRLGAAYVVLLLFLGKPVWEDFPGAAMRVLLPLTLAFNVLAHRARTTVAWLIVGNLGILAGLLAWRGAPSDLQELAHAHANGHAAIARPGEGWYGMEQHNGHRWQWTSSRGTVMVETWPRTQRIALDLEFSLRSPMARTVVLRQRGRELWRAPIGAKLSVHRVAVVLEPGGEALEFSTETPGQPESPAPGARSLAFALYDLRISAADK